MVLRLVPETEERDSNSPQGRRLNFNGHGHRVFMKQARMAKGGGGRGGGPHFPRPWHEVGGNGGRREDAFDSTDLVF